MYMVHVHGRNISQLSEMNLGLSYFKIFSNLKTQNITLILKIIFVRGLAEGHAMHIHTCIKREMCVT